MLQVALVIMICIEAADFVGQLFSEKGTLSGIGWDFVSIILIGYALSRGGSFMSWVGLGYAFISASSAFYGFIEIVMGKEKGLKRFFVSSGEFLLLCIGLTGII